MALDGATLRIIKNELNKNAVGARIEKITMPYKDRLILSLSARGFSKKLLLSCSPSSPRICYTEQKYENPPVPPMVCMLLRKRLTSGRLREVRQAGLDRVLMLDFDCKNELGDDIILTVIIEIMGRLSNVIITQDGRIIDCIRRFDPEEGKRFLLPGAVYELPAPQDKVNIIDGDVKDVITRLKKSALPLDRALMNVLDGISPIISREAAYRTLSDPQKSADKMNDYEYDKLTGILGEVKEAVQCGGEPIICYDDKGTPKDFTFIPITQYGSKWSYKKCDSVSCMIDGFYSERDSAELIRRQSADMIKLLSNLSERCERKLHNRENELKATKSREKYRIYGELVKANIHAVKSGDSFLQCVNYYDENCAQIRIPLDVALSPSKNAQKYFNEYRKLSNAAGMLERLIDEAKSEKQYIESVFDSLCRAKSAADIMQIREELVSSGYVKSNPKKREKPVKNKPDEYLSSDGYTLLVGKNNKQNDELTLKTADKRDMWFHTKDIPGSHVIVRNESGEDIPESTIAQAAYLAAKNSKAAASRGVAVDYTPVKFVKKPSGAKPGMVIYTTNKTFYADPLDDEIGVMIKKI